ncbi:GspH/FimT family pseudopilin [Variovorax sp. WS11]|uniref:GspH/FimT family pseudopilin n=1 Tax=Variovorax sp. WS11 TaxID=1105204 RepID=UPI001EF28571|nr:GspH/FimT family pseudopilin [Variovorax sp. WS11]
MSIRHQTSSRSRGFTLIELMVTITVLAILLVVAVPSFDGVRLSSRLTSYATDLMASSQLARTEAIKRNAPVTLCVSSNGTGCATSGGWESGWIVLSGTTVIQRQPAATAGYKLTEAGGAISLTFDSTGIGSTQASVTICRASPSVGGQERLVKISATGRASITRTTLGTCT